MHEGSRTLSARRHSVSDCCVYQFRHLSILTTVTQVVTQDEVRSVAAVASTHGLYFEVCEALL